MRSQVTEETRLEILRLCAAGVAQRTIAKQLGCSVGCVQYQAAKAGVISRRLWTKERTDRCAELYKGGMTLEEVAKEVGSNKYRVSQALKGIGVVINPRCSFPKGEENIAWNGGTITQKGYVFLRRPDHPCATKGGYVAEHRLVMEEVLGRYLLPTEVVHHDNKIVTDNRPCNLRLFASNADHLRHELTGRVPNWTEDGKRRMQESCERKKLLAKKRRLPCNSRKNTDRNHSAK